MRQKKDFFSRVGERLGLPREGLPGGFSAFLSGAGEVTVRGCRKILRYEPAVPPVIPSAIDFIITSIAATFQSPSAPKP